MSLITNNLQLSGKNIVIVEDDHASIRYYQTLLHNTGAEVKICNNGKEFIDYISGDVNIDLVFMDFLIPLINGVDCLRIFRKERKKVPVLILTAYSSEQTKTEAYIAGCNEYILKPIYPEMIFFLLEKYLTAEKSVFINK